MVMSIVSCLLVVYICLYIKTQDGFIKEADNLCVFRGKYLIYSVSNLIFLNMNYVGIKVL